MSDQDDADGGNEPRYLVVGVDLRTPVDVARDLERALAYYAHVYACFAEACDFARREWLHTRSRATLEEIATRGDEGAGLEIERRRAGRWLWRSVEMAARANVRLNVPAFDPDRPLGPGSMVRWAQHGPLDYAGRINPRMHRFRLGEWVTVTDRQLPKHGSVRSGKQFTVTNEIPWHDPRVPGSGEAADKAIALQKHPPRVKQEPIDPSKDGTANARARIEAYKRLKAAMDSGPFNVPKVLRPPTKAAEDIDDD